MTDWQQKDTLICPFVLWSRKESKVGEPVIYLAACRHARDCPTCEGVDYLCPVPHRDEDHFRIERGKP